MDVRSEVEVVDRLRVRCETEEKKGCWVVMAESRMRE